MEEKKTTAVDELDQLRMDVEEAIAAIKVDVARTEGSYVLALAWPIQVGAETRSEITLRQQTIRDIREHKSGSDDAFTAALCGLTVDHIQQLSPDDWNAVQAVIEGFTLRRVASGRARLGSAMKSPTR